MANSDDVSMDVRDDDEQFPKSPKLDVDVPTCVTNYFPQRDKEVHMVLNWMMLDGNGQPHVRLP